MDCRTFHRRLEDYLEGGLDFPGRFGMERHAKQCYACEKDVNEALRLRQMAHELSRVVAPPDFEASLLARIRNERPPRRFWQRRSWWLYGFEGFSWRVASVTALITVFVVGTVSYIHLRPGLNHPSQPRASVESPASPRMEANPGVTVKEAGSTPDGARDLTNAAPQRASASGLEGAGRAGRDKWTTPFADPADSEFVEFLVPVSGDRQLIMRLPRTIRMRLDQPSREYFIRNVSH